MHSKGPWNIGGLVGTRVDVFSEDGKLIASVNKGYQDAHLIAAAPEMLEALEAVDGLLDTINDYSSTHAIVRAAISKAKGETT